VLTIALLSPTAPKHVAHPLGIRSIDDQAYSQDAAFRAGPERHHRHLPPAREASVRADLDAPGLAAARADGRGHERTIAPGGRGMEGR